MPIEKMRSGIKLLSLSARRELVRRRPLPRKNFSQVRALSGVHTGTETSGDRSKVFPGITTDYRIHSTTNRGFRSLSKSLSPDEFEGDSNLDEDIDSLVFDDEITDDERDKDRIWMDPDTPLEQRVDRFINQPLGSIHHLDIKLTSRDLIRECGKLRSFEGMKKAQDILDRLVEEKRFVNNSQDTPTCIIIPDRPFQMVMYGWANMCRKVKVAPQRMREVLDLMIQEAEYDKKIREGINTTRSETQSSDDNGDDHEIDTEDLFEGLSCEPTVDIYNTLLQGLSQAATRSIQAAIEAEQALSKMEKMNRTRGWHTKPNTRSYSLVLNAYANSKHATAGERAESVLRNMIERHEFEKQDYFEEYGIEYNTADEEFNERKIVTPDTIAYTMVIQAHGASDLPESADRAMMLLNELIQSDNPALTPDSFCFATTINAFSKMAARKKSPRERIEAAECAEDILWMMVDEIEKKNQSNTEHSLSGNIVPFNACMNAWAQSFTPESPQRAEELLHRMLDPELQSITQVQPNTVSFNTCMQAWSKACKFEGSATPEKAEEILTLLIKLSEEMETSSDEGWKLCPDVRSYATVMNAYALSKNEDSVIQTRRLLKDLIQKEGRYFDSNSQDRMNAYPFTIVLKAAANAKEQDGSSGQADDLAFGSLDSNDEGLLVEDPYTIALDTYSDILNDTYELGVRPDHFVFSEMLAVIAKYTSAESIERRQRIEEIFEDACIAGQVSSLVVKAMQKACPNDIVLTDLLRLRGNSTVASIETVNIFPRQWTSRVPQEFRRVSSRNDHFKKQSNFYRSKNTKGEGRKGKKFAGKQSKTRRRNNNN